MAQPSGEGHVAISGVHTDPWDTEDRISWADRFCLFHAVVTLSEKSPLGVEVHSPLFLVLAHCSARARAVIDSHPFLPRRPFSLTLAALALLLPNKISELSSLPRALLSWGPGLRELPYIHNLEHWVTVLNIVHSSINCNSEKHPAFQQWEDTFVNMEYESVWIKQMIISPKKQKKKSSWTGTVF